MPHVSKLLVLTLVLGLTLAVPLYAQTQDLKFEHINVADGLSQGNVSAMFQDRQGFLWFGTWDGLNKYDGYGFTTYYHNPLDTTSLSDNFIQAITEGPDGTLWIGTRSGGLNRFDPTTERFTHYRHDPDDSHTLSHDGIAHIHVDRAGRLWILSRDQQAGLNVTYPTPFTRLDRLDPETGLVTRYRHDPDDPQSLGHDVVPVQGTIPRCMKTGTVYCGSLHGAAASTDTIRRRTALSNISTTFSTTRTNLPGRPITPGSLSRTEPATSGSARGPVSSASTRRRRPSPISSMIPTTPPV